MSAVMRRLQGPLPSNTSGSSLLTEGIFPEVCMAQSCCVQSEATKEQALWKTSACIGITRGALQTQTAERAHRQSI